jgi:hypothetical protein
MLEIEPILSQAREFEVVFESYGVRFKIQASSRQLLVDAEKTARTALLGRLQIVESAVAEHVFDISKGDDNVFHLTRNGEHISYDSSEPRFYRFFDSILRITVAEYARDRVFVHAGVVGWKGKAIVIPANSFRGKTTLVAELVRAGAEYYSDEYAIIDPEGLVHSFPRDLAVRYEDEGTKERLVKPEEIGARIGSAAIPIGLVLITEYAEDGTWEPESLTVGRGIMEMIPHAIPRLYNPEFTLKVLNTALSDAIILKSFRGDASSLAAELISFFDNCLNLAKIT